MRFTPALCAAALALRTARADFMVYTSPPIPTSAVPSFAHASDYSSWTTSVVINAGVAYASYTKSLGAPWQSSVSSAASEISAWAATASNYSIPAAVTDPATVTSFYAKPDWYTALPSGARAFKEQQVSVQFSIVQDVIARHATTAAASGSKGAAPLPTQRAGLGAGFGAMAAVAAGVFL